MNASDQKIPLQAPKPPWHSRLGGIGLACAILGILIYYASLPATDVKNSRVHVAIHLGALVLQLLGVILLLLWASVTSSHVWKARRARDRRGFEVIAGKTIDRKEL
jgi:hypothetical protein